MKTIGLLGGMSAASTQLYYKRLCEQTQVLLGGLHSPELLIRSVDFAQIEAWQMTGEWDKAAHKLNQEARALERGGAQLLLLATNTMHKLEKDIVSGLNIPFLHIAEATASSIVDAGFKNPGLIATRFTMEQHFYTDKLKQAGLTPHIPNPTDRSDTHRIIYEELCKNDIVPASRIRYEEIAQSLVDDGADCLILGCTEVGMLLNSSNVIVPVFDTTLIHCDSALRFALA